jgi:hypothetical protein
MALRPVSELGLVDLTDLASPPAPATTKRRGTDGDAPKKPSRRSADAGAATAMKPPAPDRASRRRASRAVAEKVGMSVTCVVAGVAGIMLGRAAIHS